MEMDPEAAQPSKPTRRFIYLIMDGGNDTHTLHRIDTRPLFARGKGARRHRPEPEATRRFAAGGKRARHRHGHGHGAPEPEAEAAPQPAATQPQPLPHPLARFDCAAGRQFLPVGRGVDQKLVSVDRNRHTVIFDTRTESVRAGPDARHVKWHGWGSTFAEAGGRLYHLGRGPGFEEVACLDFEALTYDPHRDDWSWNTLPSPPLGRFVTNATVESFADAGAGAASTIRISVRSSTFAFNAARASWREEGHWALPFHGRAQYVADYGLWSGFLGSRETDLCAADLDVAGRPVHRYVWANVDGYANYGGHSFSYLSYLGSGRLCVTRFFRDMDKDGRRVMAAVVTALKAKRSVASATGEIQMVRRASVRYHSPECELLPYWAY